MVSMNGYIYFLNYFFVLSFQSLLAVMPTLSVQCTAFMEILQIDELSWNGITRSACIRHLVFGYTFTVTMVSTVCAAIP